MVKPGSLFISDCLRYNQSFRERIWKFIPLLYFFWDHFAIEMALIVRIFWFALIYYATLKFSSACSCQHPTLSEAVKNSDWVSRLTVVGVKPEPAKRGRRSNFLVITVKHQNPIKVPESMKTKGLPEKIRTSIYSSMCGLKVDKDKTYTLAGQVYNGALQADLCGLVKSVS